MRFTPYVSAIGARVSWSSMVTPRIFTRVRQAMVPMVFCSVSFGQSFALGSTRPLAICMGAGADRSRALLLFSRTLS